MPNNYIYCKIMLNLYIHSLLFVNAQILKKEGNELIKKGNNRDIT